MEKGRRMSGSTRDLAAVDLWSASLERSLERRARRNRGRVRNGAAAAPALLRRVSGGGRDLASTEPWQLSLGRSRARRRAAALQFVPAGSRAKRISIGTLAALTVGPTASVASGQASVNATASGPEPTTTTEHSIVLSSGAEGRQVQLLQAALGGIKVDGVFGPETEAAVRRFQASRGLGVDGIAGPLTTGALRGASSGSRSFAADISASTPGEGASSEAAPGEAAGEAASGSEQTQPSAVARLQHALHLSADGIFGPQTEAAVRRLQARHGLTVDGIVGPETWSVVGVSGAETLTPPPSALPAPAEPEHAHAVDAANVTPAPSSDAGLSPVARLQKALKIAPDGEFGPATEAAVLRLQARHGLPQDGVVGPATWAVLGITTEGTLTAPASARVQSAGQEGSAPATASSAGASSDAGLSPVARLQKALKIAPDGEFGPATEAAVLRLQARHGLPQDGVVGPATWAVLGITTEGTLTPPASARVQSAGQEGSGGSTSSTGEASGVVARVIAAGNEIATRPYVWGGGHGSFQSGGYDCSGSVSYALHGGGLLSSPLDSTGFESYGEPGPGRDITIYANAEHAFMVVV